MDENTIMDEMFSEIERFFEQKGLLDPRKEINSDATKIRINWKIEGATGRPNKQAKNLIIKFSDEAIEAITDNISKKHFYKENLNKYLEKKYQDYDPDHDAAYGVDQPKEYWIIQPNDLGLK